MLISDLPYYMFKCLVLTIIIELIIAIIIGIRGKKNIINVVLVNIITNPLVVTLPFFLLIVFNYQVYKYSIYFLEVITLITEGFIYYKVLDYKRINPFIISLILNGASYLLGFVIN